MVVSRPRGTAVLAVLAGLPGLPVVLTACTDDAIPKATATSSASASSTTNAVTTPGTDPSKTITRIPTLTSDPTTSQYDYCTGQAAFTGAASDKFGADEVMDAYCTFVKLEMEQSFIDSHMRADDADLTVQDFSVWHDYMTKETADHWDATVATALTGDMDAKQDVWSLMFYNAVNGSGYSFTDQPVVLNQAFTPAETDVDVSAGEERLVLAFNVSADLNVVKDGTEDPYYLIHVDRRIVLALVPNPVPDNEDTDWLIDSWKGTFTIGKPTQRGDLPTTAATP